MKSRTIFEAFDGTTFDSADECRAHEAKHVEARLVGLTADQIAAAIARTDQDLADAIETVAGRIAKARREAGDLKRRPRGAGQGEPQEVAEPERQAEELAMPESELSPAYRGDRDFKAGKPGVIPDDLRDTPDKAEEYMAAWDAASVASFKAGQAQAAA